MTKRILIYDENQAYLGYLMLNDQMYFPYTAMGQFLGKGFFNAENAESYLHEHYQTHPHAQSEIVYPASRPTMNQE